MTLAEWAEFCMESKHYLPATVDTVRMVACEECANAYASQKVREALAEAEVRLEELNSEGEHDKDYHEGYSQAIHDAIAALWGKE